MPANTNALRWPAASPDIVPNSLPPPPPCAYIHVLPVLDDVTSSRFSSPPYEYGIGSAVSRPRRLFRGTLLSLPMFPSDSFDRWMDSEGMLRLFVEITYFSFSFLSLILRAMLRVVDTVIRRGGHSFVLNEQLFVLFLIDHFYFP